MGEALFTEIMVDNFPELKHTKLQIQEAQRISSQTKSVYGFLKDVLHQGGK